MYTTKDYSTSVGKIYTNIEGLWNRLVPRSEKKKPLWAMRLLEWKPWGLEEKSSKTCYFVFVGVLPSYATPWFYPFFFLGVDFWLISCAFVCFIGSFKSFKMRSNNLSAYHLIESFEIWGTSQHGSFFCCHVGVYIIFEEVVQVDERFLLTLQGLWPTISLLFRSPFTPHVLLIPTAH